MNTKENPGQQEIWEIIKAGGVYYWQEWNSGRIVPGRQDIREATFYQARLAK